MMGKGKNNMNDTEINKAICKKLGLPWHSEEDNHGNKGYLTECSCGQKFNTNLELWLHVDNNPSNPDFLSNAAMLLNELDKKDELENFIDSLDIYWFKPTLNFITKYILNPRQLAEEFLRWEGK